MLGAGGGGGNGLLTKHVIRATGGSKKEKQNNTRRGEKKLPSPAIAPSCVFLVKFPSSMFTLIFFYPPSPTSSSVFFISSLVCTDQNPVNAYEPIGRQLGGCHGDTVGGACASRTANLLRFDIGGASI